MDRRVLPAARQALGLLSLGLAAVPLSGHAAVADNRFADAARGDENEVDRLVLKDLGGLASRHESSSDLLEKFRRRLGLPDPSPREP